MDNPIKEKIRKSVETYEKLILNDLEIWRDKLIDYVEPFKEADKSLNAYKLVNELNDFCSNYAGKKIHQLLNDPAVAKAVGKIDILSEFYLKDLFYKHLRREIGVIYFHEFKAFENRLRSDKLDNSDLLVLEYLVKNINTILDREYNQHDFFIPAKQLIADQHFLRKRSEFKDPVFFFSSVYHIIKNKYQETKKPPKKAKKGRKKNQPAKSPRLFAGHFQNELIYELIDPLITNDDFWMDIDAVLPVFPFASRVNRDSKIRGIYCFGRLNNGESYENILNNVLDGKVPDVVFEAFRRVLLNEKPDFGIFKIFRVGKKESPSKRNLIDNLKERIGQKPGLSTKPINCLKNDIRKFKYIVAAGILRYYKDVRDLPMDLTPINDGCDDSDIEMIKAILNKKVLKIKKGKETLFWKNFNYVLDNI